MRTLSKVLSILSVVICVGATFAAAPAPNQTPKQMIWMIQVSIPDQPDFSVAAPPVGSEEKPFGVIPLKKAGIPAVAVTAQQRENDFVVNLYAARNFKPGMKCQELRAMLTGPVASLTTAKGQMITTESFANYGLPSIGLLAYQKEAPVGKLRPLGCCGCGGLTCCPNKGQCIDCSICGMCCSN